MTDIFSRSLFLFAAGILATVLIWAHPGFALAQDAADEDVSAQPNAVVPNIAGCWQGTAFNDSQGNTSILFFFAQKKNKISKKNSTIDLEANVLIHGPISGKVTSTHFRFTVMCSLQVSPTGATSRGLHLSRRMVVTKEAFSTSGSASNINSRADEFSKLVPATCP